MGKLLLPVLGDHYGKVLERGELRPELDQEGGSFWIRYGDTRFPLSPWAYPSLLREAAGRAAQEGDRLMEAAVEVEAIPAQGPREAAERMEAFKVRLAGLLGGSDALSDAVQEVLQELAVKRGSSLFQMGSLKSRFPPIR